MAHTNLFLSSPLVRWGIPVGCAAVAGGIALLLIEDRIVRIGIFIVAAYDVLTVPQVLNNIAQDGELPPT